MKGVWYHGGRPGLQPGQWLLPPAVTGTLTAPQMLAAMGMDPWQAGMEADRHDPGRVFLTRARDLGRAYAGLWAMTGRGPHGTLYEVVPAELDPDPDLEGSFPGLSVQAPFALVTGIAATPVLPDARRFERVLARYTTFKAGRCPNCAHDSAAPQPSCPCATCACLHARLGLPVRIA